jgi:hypothetical protein
MINDPTYFVFSWSLTPDFSSLGRERRMDEEVQYLPDQGLARRLSQKVIQYFISFHFIWVFFGVFLSLVQASSLQQ